MVNEAVAVGGKGLFTFATPFGKINTIVTIVVLAFLVIYGSIQSVQEKSIYPLVNNVLVKTIGADHMISESLDSLNPVLVEPSPKFLTSDWFKYWWKMFGLWLDILISLWFIYIVIYSLYKLFEGLNNTNPLMNVGYAFILFAILQLVVGLLIYPDALVSGRAGLPLVVVDGVSYLDTSSCGDSCSIFLINDAFKHSYPFEGVVKLILRIANGSLFDKANAWLMTDTGQLVSNVPTTVINSSGVD